MGDPKKSRRKYATPKHPWRSDRIEAERKIVNEYGLKNKKEIWRAEYLLRNYRRQAVRLQGLRTEQARKEEKLLLDKLKRLGLIGENAILDDVLTLKVGAILNKRLQTVVLKKGLANTPGQARQFVVHGHISIGNRKTMSPSYLVQKAEEKDVRYTENTSVATLAKPKVAAEGAPAPTTEEAE